MNLWTIENGRFGVRMTSHSPWSPGHHRAAVESQVKHLHLNGAFGWRGANVDFLRDLPLLEALTLIGGGLDDDSAVNELSELRHLQLDTACRSVIRFERFVKLKSCILSWRPKAASVLEHPTLSILRTSHAPARTLHDFSRMSGLEELALVAALRLESLDGASELRRLKWLTIRRAPRLTTIEHVDELHNLEHLELMFCRKIRSIAPLASMTQLKTLDLSYNDVLDTLRPVEGLRNLEELFFVGGTKVLDGNLDHLRRLKKVKYGGFSCFPHYSLRDDDLGWADKPEISSRFL